MKINNLSAVLLAHRDDTRLSNALASLKMCEKIIIVDNNSGVDWKQIEKSLSVDLFVIPYNRELQDFSQAKNTGLQKVKTQWVILLDSDEELPKTTQNEIAHLIQSNLYDVISFQRKDIFLGKTIEFGEAGSVYIPRLFKRERAQFSRPVHEVLESIGRQGQAQNPILHYSHTSISSFLQKVTKYAKIEADFQDMPKADVTPKMLLYPPTKFIYNFILKLGFLDGYRGFVYAIMMSLHSFFVRVYRYENNK